jgi:hypothetical protein
MGRNRAGLYFLGDDGVFDWAVGLLESLRAVAPDVNLYCLPFSDRVGRLSRLAARYRFEVVADPSLAELDTIGRDLLARYDPPAAAWKAGMFRKFYPFWGPLGRFLFLDADIVVLDGFPALLNRVLAGNLGVRYAHSDPEMVYRPGELRDRMTREYGSRAINAGLWAGAAGLFTLDRVRKLASAARLDAPRFNPHCMDQPFLNYCLDVGRVPMERFDEIGAGGCAWAGDPRLLTVDRRPGGRLSIRWPDGSAVPAIHWAGFQLHHRSPRYRVFRHFRTAPMTLAERLQWARREVGEKLAGVFAGEK